MKSESNSSSFGKSIYKSSKQNYSVLVYHPYNKLKNVFLSIKKFLMNKLNKNINNKLIYRFYNKYKFFN